MKQKNLKLLGLRLLPPFFMYGRRLTIRCELIFLCSFSNIFLLEIFQLSPIESVIALG